MRYLDTRTLAQLDELRRRERGVGRARQRSYVWLVWMQPHLRRERGEKTAVRTVLRWPVYLLHGAARAPS